MGEDIPEAVKRSHIKVAIIISAVAVLAVLGLVYVLMLWQPTPDKTITQTLQQKITPPKEIKAADQELQQADQTLETDLDTTELDQEIDSLL